MSENSMKGTLIKRASKLDAVAIESQMTGHSRCKLYPRVDRMQGSAEMAHELRYKASEVPSSLDERAAGMGLSSRKGRRYQSRLCKSQ